MFFVTLSKAAEMDNVALYWIIDFYNTDDIIFLLPNEGLYLSHWIIKEMNL